MSEIRTLALSVDAYVDEAQASLPFHRDVTLALRAGADTDLQAFIFFALPFAPGEVTVLDAELRLWNAGAWTGSTTITVKRVDQAWVEELLTWNSRPSVVATNAGVLLAVTPADKTMLEIPLTAMIQDAAGGAPWYGVRVEVDTAGLKRVHSSEGADPALVPQLMITYARAPQAPDQLKPSGDQHVSVAKPVLAYRFQDADTSGTGQTALELQVDDANTFATPEFSSGIIATTQQFLDLATTAYGGVPDLGQRWWRVRARDADNLWSPWSEAAVFQRTTKGTLTLDTPAVGSPVVNETTPTVEWTLTGRTQLSYQVLIHRLVAGVPDELVYDSGIVIGTNTAHGVPSEWNAARVIDREDQDYRVTLRVWDTVQRVGTTNDPEYSEVTREFTYVRGGTPAAVTTLVVTQAGPGVQLDWSRAVVPLYFALKEDDVLVRDRIVPTDVSIGGPDYRMLYYGSVPGEEHVYEVEAVEDI